MPHLTEAEKTELALLEISYETHAAGNGPAPQEKVELRRQKLLEKGLGTGGAAVPNLALRNTMEAEGTRKSARGRASDSGVMMEEDAESHTKQARPSPREDGLRGAASSTWRTAMASRSLSSSSSQASEPGGDGGGNTTNGASKVASPGRPPHAGGPKGKQ